MIAAVLERKAAALKAAVATAVEKLYGPECAAECRFEIVRPRDAANGQFAATAALVLGKILRRPPVEIADEITAELVLPEGERALRMGKGFINFFVDPGFLLKELAPEPELPPLPELPEPNDPAFPAVYAAMRLCAVLKYQGTPPIGGEDLSILTKPEELRLLWAIFGTDADELRAAALDFYDRIGLQSDCAELARARYVLLGNAALELHVLL